MTGVGAYYYIVWAVWLRHCLNERQDEFVLNWPSVWSLPEVISLEDMEEEKVHKWTNGYANGHVQGNGSTYANGNGNGNGKTHANGNGNGRGHGTREDRKSV